MDRIIVVSEHAKQVFQRTEYKAVNEQTNEEFPYILTCPVDAVNYPVKVYKKEDLPELNLDLGTKTEKIEEV